MATVRKNIKQVPVTTYQEVPEYVLTLTEDELRRVAICLYAMEAGPTKVWDSLPAEVRLWVEARTSEQRRNYLKVGEAASEGFVPYPTYPKYDPLRRGRFA